MNRFGKRIIEQYWMHDDTDCVLNDINQPFVLGAGDANPETGYPGEYAEKWNRRAENDGRWISWEEAGNCVPSPDRHECSVCHDAAQVLVNGFELLSDYCPNCGAKMDGGDNTER